MLNMERRFKEYLTEAAVFTAIIRSRADQFPEFRGHSGCPGSKRSPGFGTQYGKNCVGRDEGLEFTPLVRRDGSFGIFVGQFMIPYFIVRVRMNPGHRLQNFLTNPFRERKEHAPEN